jgi:hypothetical protein
LNYFATLQPWFDRLRPLLLPCSGLELRSRRYLLRHAHRKARAVRQRAGDRSLWRAGATSIVGKDFLPAIAPKSPLLGSAIGCWARPSAFLLRDDGIVPLICPTCQNVFAGFAQSIHASDHHATLHGVVFDILVGSENSVGLAAVFSDDDRRMACRAVAREPRGSLLRFAV